MNIAIVDAKSKLLQHIPERNNCECGNQIVLEVGDIVRVMPSKYPDALSWEKPTRLQIVCPVCFRGIVWVNENPNQANIGGLP